MTTHQLARALRRGLRGARTEFGRPLVNSDFTLALVAGQSVTDVSQNVFASLGWTGVAR